jgi:fatty-acid desaturase
MNDRRLVARLRILICQRLPESEVTAAPRIWTTTLMFSLTAAAALILVPWYGYAHGFTPFAWVCFAVLLSANEMAITCGYHRLFAHASYQAHPLLKAAYLLFGAMALQNSALIWSAGHRAHHRFIDDPERDPYCARRGFWFSPIGWMLHNYPSGKPDLGGRHVLAGGHIETCGKPSLDVFHQFSHTHCRSSALHGRQHLA